MINNRFGIIGVNYGCLIIGLELWVWNFISGISVMKEKNFKNVICIDCY